MAAGPAGTRTFHPSVKGKGGLHTFFFSRERDSLILSTRSSLFPSNFSPSFHCLIQLYLLMSLSGNWGRRGQKEDESALPLVLPQSKEGIQLTKPTITTFHFPRMPITFFLFVYWEQMCLSHSQTRDTWGTVLWCWGLEPGSAP